LDPSLINQRGRKERRVNKGRIDVDFETIHGLVIVECKVTCVVDEDAAQLRRYMDALVDDGATVAAAYLVAAPPNRGFNEDILNHEPAIRLLYLLEHFPLELSLCEGRHYFDAADSECNICHKPALPGHEIVLSI
jgi:hypothetical protein